MFGKRKEPLLTFQYRRSVVTPATVCQYLADLEVDGWHLKYIMPEQNGQIEVYSKKYFWEEQ